MSAVLLALQSALPAEEHSTFFFLANLAVPGQGHSYHFMGVFNLHIVLPASGCRKVFSSCVCFQSCSFAQVEHNSFGWCVGELGSENALKYSPPGKAHHLYPGDASSTFFPSPVVSSRFFFLLFDFFFY